jgi:hypothetical protein
LALGTNSLVSVKHGLWQSECRISGALHLSKPALKIILLGERNLVILSEPVEVVKCSI